jgi:exopolysaccharide production protein ExoZ
VNKLTGIEAGRGVAALLVVAVHAGSHLEKAFGPSLVSTATTFGHIGVDFFFVLSGFIIMHVHTADIGRPAKLGHYLQRRFTRIYPFYWVVTALAVASIIIFHPLPPPTTLLTSVFLLPLPIEPVVAVAWSLQREVVFYAVFAVLIINRRAGLALMAAWLALIVTDLINSTSDTNVIWSVHSFFDCEFFLGMFAAWLLRRYTLPYPWVFLVVGAVVFFGFGIAEDTRVIVGVANSTHLGYGIASMLMVIGVVETERQGKLRPPAWLVTIGSASYSLYLTHLLAIGIVWQVLIRTRLADTLPLWLDFVLFVIGAVIVGVVASWIVEKPVTRIARQLLTKADGLIFARSVPAVDR